MTCKGCERQIEMMAMNVEDAIDEQLAMERNHASLELRDQRLAICQGCQYLANETCLHCGCFVRFRASLDQKKCPIGKW